MQTIILLSENREFIDKNINGIKNGLAISSFDILEVKTESALGIADVKRIINESIHKPYSGKNRLVIIADFHLSTPEAQNALLKYLEEARQSLSIILIAKNEQNILPTVISRCRIIRDIRKKPGKTIDILPILSMSKGERLNFLMKNIITKDGAVEFIDNLLATLDHELLKGQSLPLQGLPLTKLEIAKLMKKTETARKYLESNVNYKLVLDVLLLGFPGIKRETLA